MAEEKEKIETKESQDKKKWPAFKGIYRNSEERMDFIKGRILNLNPPIGEKFGALGTLKILPFRIVEVPTGYDLVKFTMGKAEKKVRKAKDGDGNDIIERDPQNGWKFIWGWYGLYQTAAVLDTRVHQKDVSAQNVISKDGIEIEKLDALMNFRVFDPYFALTRTKADPEDLAISVGKAKIVSHAGSKTLTDLVMEIAQREGESKIDLAPTPESKEYKDLARLGLEIEGIYLENVNIPDALREKIGQEAIVRSEAAGIRVKANAERYRQEQLAIAEKNSMLEIIKSIREEYGLNGKEALRAYMALKELDIHEDIAKREGPTTYFHLPEIVDKIARAVRKEE